MSAFPQSPFQIHIYTALLILLAQIATLVCLGARTMEGLLVWLTLLAGGVLGLVLYHARACRYRCAECRRAFWLPLWRDLFIPTSADERGWFKLLRCPFCQRICKTALVFRGKES